MQNLATVQVQAVNELVAMVRQYDQLKDRDTPEGKELVAKIRAMGWAASFFGGYEGMSKLCAAVEAQDRTAGYWINYIWDNIAGWMP